MERLQDIQSIARDVLRFEKRRGEWSTIPNVAERAALIHEEVSEVHKAYRDGHSKLEVWQREDGKPEGIPIELADIVLRTLATAEGWGINIAAAIQEKMTWNWENR